MRHFIINLITFNREFISNYKELLLKEKALNESLTSNNVSDIYNYPEERSIDNLLNIKKISKNSKTIPMKTISFNFGKTKNNINENKNKKFGISTIILKKGSKSGKFEMGNFNESEQSNYEINSKNIESERIDTFSNLNDLEENYYLENQDDENNKKENETYNIKSQNQAEKKSISVNEKEKNDSQQEKDKNILYINSFESIDKSNNINNKKNISRFRNYTIVGQIPLNQVNEKKIHKFSFKNRFKRSLRKKREIINLFQRANSTTMGFLKKRGASTLGLNIKRSNSRLNEEEFSEKISNFSLMNFHLEMNDNLIRLIALSIAINECRIYDDIKGYKKYYNSTIPWNNRDFYKERTLFKEYNENNIPTWICMKNDIKFNNIQFKILSFSPFVFHHIRLMDNISIDDILSSLDPANNMKKINSMKVSGGRGNNCIISTWDKKLIVKTVDTTEREILIEKMIIDYHCLMRESRSLLSRIYGIFKLELKDKGTINIMIQRNMNELPFHTKLLTFDLKGSTVDRQIINNDDIKLSKLDLIKKYKNTVLKDKDLGIIDMKFIINAKEWEALTSIIDSDSMFLEKCEVTDYSLLVFVHKYRKEDIINKKSYTRIIPSKDKKYIFNFAIIDFLGPFNFEKKGEKLAKELVGYIKQLKDTNFSVLDPNRYGKRFRNFAKRIIIDG